MARTGLYKSEVKKARDALIVQGKHPSVDAVRIALGNTGSKTTIHKYLKELEEEDGGAGGRKASISEALQYLVERLAAQLQDEANTQIDAIRTEHAQQVHERAETIAALEKALEAAKSQLQHAEVALQEERAAHGRTRDTLQQETVARHTAEQQVADIKERLAENESHRQSLEEKHQHAREALEHYRQSVKEQRDQDQRRHEQQIQQLQAELRQSQQSIVVKQEEVTRLNQDGARLVADLSHAKKALYDEQSHRQQLEHKLQATQATEQRCTALESQLADKIAQIHALQEQRDVMAANAEKLSGQVHDLQLALAAANAKLETQQGIVTELRSYLDARSLQPAGQR
jgi:chromosome segregation ATPase